MSSFQQKAMISAWSAGSFAILNSPHVYKVTNKLFPFPTYKGGCPTYMGSLLHTAVFFSVSFLSMVLGSSKSSYGTMLKHSLYGSLIYFFVSSPHMYSVTKSLYAKTSTANGCPTMTGILLHSFVYFAVLVSVMYLP